MDRAPGLSVRLKLTLSYAGFLMLATNVLEKKPNIGDEELLDVLASNLCRCTGYQNIIKAVRAARDEMRAASS